MPTPLNPSTVAEIHQLSARGLSQHRIATAIGISSSTVNSYLRSEPQVAPHLAKARLQLEVTDGVVLVGSDAHYWPGAASTAHHGFLWACSQLAPAAVILNGDVFDGARISRFDPIGWESKPRVFEELQACQERLAEIASAAGPSARLLWTRGNHDARFESFLAKRVGEFEYIDGMHLKDHFPAWQPAMSVWVNGNTVIKHRFKGGTHAAYNNTLHSGLSVVTGHLHRLVATPFADYRGLRWSVETGTLADPYGPQFLEYTEDNPVNWQSGFAVLTYKDNQLLPPELAYVVGPGRVAFRGEIHNV